MAHDGVWRRCYGSRRREEKVVVVIVVGEMKEGMRVNEYGRE